MILLLFWVGGGWMGEIETKDQLSPTEVVIGTEFGSCSVGRTSQISPSDRLLKLGFNNGDYNRLYKEAHFLESLFLMKIDCGRRMLP